MVQVAHVCVDAGRLWGHDKSHMVLLAVPSQEALLKVERRLQEHHISYTTFYEPDDDMGFTAVATRQIVPDERKHFKHYQLWRPENASTQQPQDLFSAASPARPGESLAS